MTDLFGTQILVDPTSKRNRRPITNPLIPIFGTYNNSPGTRCKDCRHFQRCRFWFKCVLRKTGGPATGHRVNYKACGRFAAILPTCIGCGATRLDTCYLLRQLHSTCKK